MTVYRAIVSVTFTDRDIREMAEAMDVEFERLANDPLSLVSGELDNLSLGSTWVEQLFEDGRPTMFRLSSGDINVEIGPHDLEDPDDEDDDEEDFDEDEKSSEEGDDEQEGNKEDTDHDD